MAILGRVVKVTAALLTSNVVNLVTRLLLPPLFLYRYGATLYGEWLALSGAVAYLSTLNFGIQTYITQDLVIRYQQKDMANYHLRQSTALRLLLGILGGAALVALLVFALPAKSLLHLTISQSTAVWTLYFLALQVLLTVLFGYFTGIYTVLSRAHTGVLWVNGQRLCMVLLVSLGAWRRWSFPVLAACQLGIYAVGVMLILLHIRRIAPEIFPQLSSWDGDAARSMLQPSGYFGLISWSTFLSYEIPVLVLQREIGPFGVVAFTVMRTIYSMVRQALNAVTQSLAPEITRLYGREDWLMLARLYAYSERFLYAMAPTANLALLLLSPVLLQIWLHRPGLYAVAPYTCMAAIAIVLAAKEHKFQFQYATNTHEQLARLMFGSYIALAMISVPMVHWLGMLGFLAAWFAVEVYQVARMLPMNRQLFAQAAERKVSTAQQQEQIEQERAVESVLQVPEPGANHATLRLLAISALGLTGAGLLLRQTWQSTFAVQISVAVGYGLAVGAGAYFLFKLQPLLGLVAGKLLGRRADFAG